MLNEVFEAVKRAGAIGVGVTPIVPMGDEVFSEFGGWLANGENAGMNYLENYPEIRRINIGLTATGRLVFRTAKHRKNLKTEPSGRLKKS